MTKVSALLSLDEKFCQFVPSYFGSEPFMKELFNFGPSIVEQEYVSFLYTGNFFYDGSGLLHIENCSDIPENFFSNNPEIGILQKDQIASDHINYMDKTKICIALIHPGTGIYGHWLIDILPKVNSFRTEYPKHNPNIITMAHTPSWALEAINVLTDFSGEVVLLQQGEIYHGSIYLCSPTRFHDRMSVRSVSLRRVPNKSESKEKLFIARRGRHTGRDLNNRDDFEKLVLNFGFKYLYPEDITLLEQVNAFSSAKYIIGESGSGMHNSIFSPEEAKVIVIQSSRQNHFIQAGLCHLSQQNVSYFWGKSDTEDWTSPFTVDLEKLSCLLADIVQK